MHADTCSIDGLSAGWLSVGCLSKTLKNEISKQFIEWIFITFGTDIHGPMMRNPTDFGDTPLLFFSTFMARTNGGKKGLLFTFCKCILLS